MGAHLNGYTSREQTAYYIKALSKDMPKGRLAELRRLRIKPCFSPTSRLPTNCPGNEVVAEQ